MTTKEAIFIVSGTIEVGCKLEECEAKRVLIRVAEENEGRKLASLWRRTGWCKIWEKDVACPLHEPCSRNHSDLLCLNPEKFLDLWAEAAKKEG